MNAENELLVVSFGTTSAESRKLNIESVEEAISEVTGENWNICRCFTSQTIINIIVRKESSIRGSKKSRGTAYTSHEGTGV